MANRKLVIALAVLCLTGSLFVVGVGNVERQVTWYPMDAPGEYDFDKQLASTTLPFVFTEDWGSGTILDSSQLLKSSLGMNLNDNVGFQARCGFFVTSAEEYSVVIRANNGVILRVDEQTVIHSWDNILPDGSGMRTVSIGVQLDVGFHTFDLWYYEWDGSALLQFDTHIEPLGFEQTAFVLKQVLAENANLAETLKATQQMHEGA